MSNVVPVRIGHLWVAITLTAAFIGPASSPLALPDVLWTLLRGAWMASRRRLLDADPFTSAPHVAGSVLNIQWLADLIFYALDGLGGLALVIAFNSAIIALTFGLVLAAAVAASGHLRLSCLSVWVAYALGVSNLSPRPQTLAAPIFALFVLALMRAEWRKDTRLLWLLPPATLLWANVHGSFFTGFVLLGCAAVGRWLETRSAHAARPYALTLAACVLASLVNPYGPGTLLYLASIGGNQIIRELVTEWAPTTVNWREGIMFFGSLVLLGAAMLRARGRVSAVELVILIVFAYLAWSSVRAVVWWGLVLAPVLARQLGGTVSHRQPTGRDQPLVNLFVLAALGLVVFVSLPWNKTLLPMLPADKQGVFAQDTPIRVGQFLSEHDPPAAGRMLNSQAWGGYLEYAAWPRHRVFLDGRIELHPDQVWYDYLDIVFPSAHWRELLAKYDISYAVLSTVEQKDLIADLRVDAGWRVSYEDDQAIVFVRNAAE